MVKCVRQRREERGGGILRSQKKRGEKVRRLPKAPSADEGGELEVGD